MRWETGTSEDPPESLPDLGFRDEKGTAGEPCIPGGKDMTPCQLLLTFLDAENTFPRLVQYTNLKARQFKDSGGKSYFDEQEEEDQPTDGYKDIPLGRYMVFFGRRWMREICLCFFPSVGLWLTIICHASRTIGPKNMKGRWET